jgi:drug/metabolite transporter (DMT)-like permease
MVKIIVILIIAAVFENIGVVLIKGGLNQIPLPSRITASEVVRVARAGLTNPRIILGVALDAAFFGCFLYMLSQRDVSLIWPLTSLGFIVAAFAAKYILDEKVSSLRWAGVILIALGAVLTSYSEAVKTNSSPPPAAASSPLRPQ